MSDTITIPVNEYEQLKVYKKLYMLRNEREHIDYQMKQLAKRRRYLYLSLAMWIFFYVLVLAAGGIAIMNAIKP